MTTNQTLLIVFHDMRLGGVQRKIIDIINYHQKYIPSTKIFLCLREKQGIFLKSIPNNIEIISPCFYTRRFNMTWFTFWLIKKIFIIKPTQILSFMDLGSIPTLIALKLLPWIKPIHTIGEDILTSKYIYTESFPFLRKILIKWLYPKADTILVQTPIQKIDLEKMIYNAISNSKIVASPNWLPLDFPPKKNTTKDKRFIDILFVGRIDNQKNLPLFLEIVRQVKKTFPTVIAFIVGDGDQKNNIKKLIKNFNLQKNVYIKKPTLNPGQYYSSAKIFLLSSNYEGFPLTLIEAISSGCLPVVRNIPELSQFFKKDRSKIIFDNSQEASKITIDLLKNPNSDHLKSYLNIILCEQKKHISDYIKYFSQSTNDQ